VYITIYWAVPLLSKLGIMQLGSWMILSIPLIFIPIIVGGISILKSEKNNQDFIKRLRLQKLKKQDWKWILIGFVALIIGSGIAFAVCNLLNLNTNPPFARNVEPWTNGRHWMFAIWIIYWPFNIIGENFVWRGVILPRMELVLGKYSWVLNTILWGIFHLAFGIGNLIVLLPTLIIVPLIAYKSKNTWTAIILHAILSGPGFITLAFGLM